jgi:hypothetical protein
MTPSFYPSSRPSSFLFGQEEGVMQTPNFTPGQMQLFETLLGQSQKGASSSFDFLSRLLAGDEDLMRSLEAPAIRGFEEQIAPGIAERFTSMGAGARGSSGFQQQIATAGSRLSQQLGEQRTGMRMSALDRMLQQVQAPLSYKPYSQTYMQRQPGLLESFLTGLPAVGGMLAGDYMKSRAMGGF